MNSSGPIRENSAVLSAQTAAPRGACFRVLGVDPAAAGPTGFGVIESDGLNCRLLHYGALRVASKRQKESLGAALQDIHEALCGLIEEFLPQAMAVEGIFSALNVRTALRLAEVRGVVLLAAAQHNVLVHSYSPREVKASVAGYGNADKRQMQVMVRALLKMTETPEPADAADALAVALCHLQAEQTRARFALPNTKISPKATATRRRADDSALRTHADLPVANRTTSAEQVRSAQLRPEAVHSGQIRTEQIRTATQR